MGRRASFWLVGSLGMAACSAPASADVSEVSTASVKQQAHPYRGACDGSAAAPFDATHLLVASDEDQVLRVYPRGGGHATQTFDLGGALGLAADAEADIEDFARVGTRIFGITSHGRDKKGRLDRSRYRFFAMDVGAAGSLSVVGHVSTLLDGMLDPSRWALPDAAVIAALTTAAALDVPDAPALAPKLHGTNIEGLARLPSPLHPSQLAIGFRNPMLASKAIVVTLTDANAALGANGGIFGRAVLLDLGGLAIRAMAWSDLHGAMLVLGGDVDQGGPSRLFTWTGEPNVDPVPVADLTPPNGSAGEAIVAWDGTSMIDVLFDQGETSVKVGGKTVACKDAAPADRSFTRARVTLPSGP